MVLEVFIHNLMHPLKVMTKEFCCIYYKAKE